MNLFLKKKQQKIDGKNQIIYEIELTPQALILGYWTVHDCADAVRTIEELRGRDVSIGYYGMSLPEPRQYPNPTEDEE